MEPIHEACARCGKPAAVCRFSKGSWEAVGGFFLLDFVAVHGFPQPVSVHRPLGAKRRVHGPAPVSWTGLGLRYPPQPLDLVVAASCTRLASAGCGSTNGSRQAPALPVRDAALCMAQRRPRDLNPEHGAGVSDHEVADGFGKGGSTCGDGILGCERTDQRAPLGVREVDVDPMVSWIGQRRSSALAHRITDITKSRSMPALLRAPDARSRGATGTRVPNAAAAGCKGSR